MPGVVRFYDTNSLTRLVQDQGLTVVVLDLDLLEVCQLTQDR